MKRSTRQIRADRARNRDRRAERRAGLLPRNSISLSELLGWTYPRDTLKPYTPPAAKRPRKIWVAP